MSPNKPPSEPNRQVDAVVPKNAEATNSATGPAKAPANLVTASTDPLAGIDFQDLRSAQRNFAELAGHVSPALAAALPPLLAESPDPDSALMMFGRLAHEFPEAARLMDRHHLLAHYAIVVFGYSRFLGETLIQNSDLLHSFLRENNLDRSFSREEFHQSLARFRSRSFEPDLSWLLARFKRREYIRIMLRDVLKIAPLAETAAEISSLADVLIEDALAEADRILQRRYGTPQYVDSEGRLLDTPFTVLSLGKLGGNELNYSSDVDLLYIFGDGSERPDSPISNREYFVRLSQQVTEILSRVTREGAVFRIDLRLRPQGSEGELAISLSQALTYYSTVAHDWERQALIKVRHSAGNTALARNFIRHVQPQVYSEAVNFAAIKTALVAREKIHRRRHDQIAQHKAGQRIDVKIDDGGIRDIEFLVQCLQRVYGGAEPWLRSGGTMFSLQKLHDKGHVSGKEFHDLTSAYEFLRHLEHRLQLRQGQQTHRLPAAQPELKILQRSMAGYAPGEDDSFDLVPTVQRRMKAVSEIYRRVIYQQQTGVTLEQSKYEFELKSTPEASLGAQSNQQILHRLALDAPALYQIASHADSDPHVEKNLFRFLGSALTSSERYAAVLEHSEMIPRALKLFASEYLSGILIQHPEEIGSLADIADSPVPVGSGYLFAQALGQARPAGDPIFSYLQDSSSSYAEKLALLRRRFRHRIFAVGARDLTELRGVYESLAAATSIAEETIEAAFGIAGKPPGLAVLALGRLGSGEFDVLSDADLLFVCDEGSNHQEQGKAVERMMQTLAAYTRDGTVFPVDTRLRPRGNEGELLVTPAQFSDYSVREAHPWEALSYSKLRFVAGSRELAERAMAAARILFQRFAEEPGFLQSVMEMRAKLDVAEVPGKSFKTSPGGIYDIDFLSSYLLVKHGIAEKNGNLRDRIWRCAGFGLLKNVDAAALDHAAEFLRTVEHVVRLVMGRALKWLPATEHAHSVTIKITEQLLQQEFPDGLEAELAETCGRVRTIYSRVLTGG